MCTVGDGIISEIKPCKGKLPADRIRDAAPVLLEALEELLNRYAGLINSGDAGIWNPEEEPEVIKARAAIKLARGE